jgi:hypothetical protein
MNIPKTLVIGINMHGELHLKEDGSPHKDTVPENMYISVINAVAPGVPNISTFEKSEELAEKVYKRIKRRKNWNKLTKTQIDNLSEGIKDLLVKTNKEQSKDIIKEHQRLYSKNQVNMVFQKFSNNYDHSFKITTYDSGNKMPDKLYLKFGEGEALNPDSIEEKYFNTIVLYNLEGEPDIFEILQSVGMDIDQITTFQLIEFLTSLGVENLIIVDLSCYVFKGESKHLTERNIRHTRRKIMSTGNKSRKTRV